MSVTERHCPSPGESVRAEAVLVADNLSVTYKTYVEQGYGLRTAVKSGFSGRTVAAVQAVRNVSVTLRAGQVLGIVGPNGAGKSTLLSALAGLIPPEEGSVSASQRPVLLGVGAVLRPSASGRRNIRLGLLALGFRGSQLDSYCQDVAEFSDIGEALDRPMTSYSSGMKARIQFGIASSARPDVLLIDEALAVGDLKFRQRSYDRIQELTQSAAAVVLVSHSLIEIERTCTDAMWLEAGQTKMVGSVDDVLAAYTEAAS